jgi:hypothetical protein
LRFVDCYVAKLLAVYWFTVNGDNLSQYHRLADVSDLAVDGYPAVTDEAFSCPPGSNAGLGKHLL